MGRPEFNNYTFYKFSCKTEDIECCYVGSTANFLARQRNHKYSTNNTNSKDYNIKLYETIRANGGWENWTMTIIGEAENISLKDARIKEEEYRVNLKAELNMRRAYLSDKQHKAYYETNKEQIKEKAKSYKEAHKERYKVVDKAYREANREEFKEYFKQYYLKNKDQVKQYYIDNIEQIKKNKKAYREANKEKIKEYNKQYNLKKKEMKSLEN